MTYNWGIIEHDHLGRLRSRRDLDLAAVVCFANEHSVPGLAGLSFLRSIVWSLIRHRVRYRETYERENRFRLWLWPKGWKLLLAGMPLMPIKQSKATPTEFAARGNCQGLRHRIYLETPCARARLCQPANQDGLGAGPPRLGLVEATNSRFNNFEMNDRGKEFLKLALGNQETSRALPKLGTWLDGGRGTRKTRSK